MKFDGVRPVAPVLGRLLADTISALEPSLPPGIIAIVPVPLYAKKKAHRGFNQAEVIARAAFRLLADAGLTAPRFEICAHSLVRTRDTGSQIGLSRRERRKNLHDAFALSDPTPVLQRNILLVDDVYTTGSTASECARVLRRAGSGRVWVATVARTLKVADVPAMTEDLSWQQSRNGHENDKESEEVAIAAQRN